MNKTMIERICPDCGVKYLFWLFGRTACNCNKDLLPKHWDYTPYDDAPTNTSRK